MSGAHDVARDAAQRLRDNPYLQLDGWSEDEANDLATVLDYLVLKEDK